jgi:hypothetical protein
LGLVAVRRDLGAGVIGVVAKTTVGFRYPRLSTFLNVDLRSLEKISSSMRPNCAPRWSE